MRAIQNAITASLKWLIFTNLYIAIAAVCFQAITFILLAAPYDYILGLNTFFSTWFIYQFSRFNFHRNYKVDEQAQTDEIYQFVDKQRKFQIVSLVISFIGTISTVIFLEPLTIITLIVLGIISTIYSLKIGNFSLRKIPFLKIYLIAFVWSCTAVILTASQIDFSYFVNESHLLNKENLNNALALLIFSFLFIVFITIPFDINDMEVDKKTDLKTIPNVFGESVTNSIVIGLLLILTYILFRYVELMFLVKISIAIFLLALSFITLRYSPTIKKWQIMAIYDGSMIVLFLLVSLQNLMSS